MSRHLVAFALAAGFAAVACAETDDHENAIGDDALTSTGRGSDEWFYSGPLPTLENPGITAALEGHTVRVTGFLPAGTSIPAIANVKTKSVGGKTQVDVVYPIATAMPGKDNSAPRTYSFYQAKPYRPNGNAFTESAGNHFVTWGGFPFLGYNDGIAFHGPITDQVQEGGGASVWYLRRGRVSSGCNRMMGEHVVELAHIIGIDMRRLYGANAAYDPATKAKVTVLGGYDQYEGQWVDVDYPTDEGAKRPGVAKNTDSVAMFGSWVAKATPDGKDFPPDMKWQGGVKGQVYDFQQHAIRGNVCSMPQGMLAELKAKTNGRVPADFCAKKYACDDAKHAICKPSEFF